MNWTWMRAVITSYSIHYTKLYEGPGGEPVRQLDEAELDLMHAFLT